MTDTQGGVALNPTTVTRSDWALIEIASGVVFHFNGPLAPYAEAFAALMQVRVEDLLYAMAEHGICETDDWSLTDIRPVEGGPDGSWACGSNYVGRGPENDCEWVEGKISRAWELVAEGLLDHVLTLDNEVAKRECVEAALIARSKLEEGFVIAAGQEWWVKTHGLASRLN